MEIANMKGIIGQLNSLDYIFIFYSLAQIYRGFVQGFRVMVFETVKWAVLFVALYLSNKVFYPYLIKLDSFSNYAQAINGWCLKSALSLAPTSNPLKEIIYVEVAKTIPYDKMAFYILVILAVSFLTKMIIIGSLSGGEAKGRVLGMIFGQLKALAVFYLVLSIIAGFMVEANPLGFEKWQKSSRILSELDYQFDGAAFAKYKKDLLGRAIQG